MKTAIIILITMISGYHVLYASAGVLCAANQPCDMTGAPAWVLTFTTVIGY